MMKLIDADKLDFLEQNYNKSQMKAILDFVDAQPTAYDVDKVVEQLEETKAYMLYENMNADVKWIDKVIEIVKAGGDIELSEHSKSQSDRTGKQKATIEAKSKTE